MTIMNSFEIKIRPICWFLTTIIIKKKFTVYTNLLPTTISYPNRNHSHSVVPGGFEVKSYSTREIPGTFSTSRTIFCTTFATQIFSLQQRKLNETKNLPQQAVPC